MYSCAVILSGSCYFSVFLPPLPRIKGAFKSWRMPFNVIGSFFSEVVYFFHSYLQLRRLRFLDEGKEPYKMQQSVCLGYISVIMSGGLKA